MKKTISYLLLLFVTLIQARAQTDSIKFWLESGNKAYVAEDFSLANQFYAKVLNSNHTSDQLHYNYANSLFKSNQVAKSILHYEKALKLNPSNENAAYNLKIANQKTVDKVESIPDLFIYRWWRFCYNLFPADSWATVLICFFVLGLIGFAVFKLSNTLSLKKIGFYSFCFGVALGAICWILAASQKNYSEAVSHAVIMDSTVDILSAPSAGSSQLFVLHEGTKVKLLSSTEGWVEISLPNGNQGWIGRQAIEEI